MGAYKVIYIYIITWVTSKFKLLDWEFQKNIKLNIRNARLILSSNQEIHWFCLYLIFLFTNEWWSNRTSSFFRKTNREPRQKWCQFSRPETFALFIYFNLIYMINKKTTRRITNKLFWPILTSMLWACLFTIS